jgi:hypothetical protein
VKTPAQFAADAFVTMSINEALGGNTLKRRLEAATASRDAEWRRLVEEAQTDAKQKALANVALRAEVDRLKGELAEARRLLKEAPVISWGGDPWARWCKERDAALESPPAEQAQGEGAPKCQRVTCDGGIKCRCAPVRERQLDPIAALAKRVDALEAACEDCEEDGAFRCEACGAGDFCGECAREHVCAEAFESLRKRLADLEATVYQKPAPPPPEAAGPGHAFVLHGKDIDKPDGLARCRFCDVQRSDHAVPPIPGRAKP